MVTKINERGRGKFKPAPNYKIEDVKEILFEKIKEETNLIIDEPDSYNDGELVFKEGKANNKRVYLFLDKTSETLFLVF